MWPLDSEEIQLLQAISRSKFLINGFRNRYLQIFLFGAMEDLIERQRNLGRVSRKLTMLRAYGLIKNIPRMPRYLIT